MTLPPAPQCYHRALAPVKNESSGQNSIPNELQQVAVGVADVMADPGGPTAVSAPDALRRSFDHCRPCIGQGVQQILLATLPHETEVSARRLRGGCA